MAGNKPGGGGVDRGGQIPEVQEENLWRPGRWKPWSPQMGDFIKHLRSQQQKNPTKLIQKTPKVAIVPHPHPCCFISGKYKQERMAPLRVRGLLLGTAQTLSQPKHSRCNTELMEASRRLQAARLRCRNSALRMRKCVTGDVRTKPLGHVGKCQLCRCFKSQSKSGSSGLS